MVRRSGGRPPDSGRAQKSKLRRRSTLRSTSKRFARKRISRTAKYRSTARKDKCSKRSPKHHRDARRYRSTTPTRPESFQLFEAFINSKHPELTSILDPIRAEVEPHTRLFKLLRIAVHYQDTPDDLKIAIANEVARVNNDDAYKILDVLANYGTRDRNSVEVRKAVLQAHNTFPEFSSIGFSDQFTLDDFEQEEDKVNVAYLKTFKPSQNIPEDLRVNLNVHQDIALVYLKAVSRRVSNGDGNMLPWLDVFNSISEPSVDVAREMKSLDDATEWRIFDM